MQITAQTEEVNLISQDINGIQADSNFGKSVSISSDGTVVAVGGPNYGDYLSAEKVAIYTITKRNVFVIDNFKYNVTSPNTV